MRHFLRLGFAATVLCCTLLAAPSSAEDAELQSLKQRLSEQEQRLDKALNRLDAVEKENAKLRAAQDDSWLDERRTESVKELVDEVVADAMTRESVYDDRMHAGYRNCFFLACPDGKYLLQFLGAVQLRYQHSHADQPADGDSDRGGFEIARFLLGFKGHVVDPSWQYFFHTGFTRKGDANFLDAYVRKSFENGTSFTFGQFKTPLLQEFLVSSKRQQFVTRSFMGAQLSGAYTQGVMFRYKTSNFQTFLSINDGLDARNEMAVAEATEGLGVTGRVEWLALGDWKQYVDFQGWPGSNPLLVFAGAYHIESGEYGTSTDEQLIQRWTLEGTTKFGDGFGLHTAVVGNHLSDSDVFPDQDQISVLIQGGLFITRDFEFVCRYEWSDMDVTGVEDLSVVTVGFNKFFASHKIKWTTDVSYAFEPLTQTTIAGRKYGFGIGGFGWRTEQPDSDGQVVLRSQLQLLF